MFTGIIQGMGAVRRITKKGDDAQLLIDAPLELEDVKIGDSVAVNGACLTVTAKSGHDFTADVSAETLKRTNLRALKTGDRVNLEKALRMSDFLSGHIVLGHVDGMGTIREKNIKSQSIIFGVEIEEGLSRYVVEKGSITIDGISLTVNSYEKNRFYVNVIPHTAQATTLGIRKVGDGVNIETDILGKYVEKFLNPRKGMDLNFLKDHGFVD
ncbi:MAG TPA: riboflavin synthase [Syntrophales bacterium]|nr:riboflavin synthase [Syntrophales bacterium]HLE16891.1 riboflavin synthase [Syntrophales bacterium]